jgi:hypothetical protein
MKYCELGARPVVCQLQYCELGARPVVCHLQYCEPGVGLLCAIRLPSAVL